MTELEDKTKKLLSEIARKINEQDDFEEELLELFRINNVEVEI